MATSSGNSSLINSLNNAPSVATNSSSASGALSGGKTIGKDEFLQLLVTQLKNQDPMDPMKDDQFAVNLAQFSQLEQLIDINNKVGNSGTQDYSGLASYLGREVTTNNSDVTVNAGDAGKLKFSLVSPSTDVAVDLVDGSGNVVATKDFGQMLAGSHTVTLDSLNAPNGDFTAKVRATGIGGAASEVPAYSVGVVSGFIPGDTPLLMLGNKQIKTSDIQQVNVASPA